MSEYLSNFVTANNIKIHYHRSTPSAQAPSIVFLHGVTDNGMCWVRVADALRDRYDVILADSRGHGLSEAPEAGYGSEDRAADVAGLIQALNLDRPVLWGHSMGADTAITAAALYPDLMRGVILEDPPFRESIIQERSQENWRVAWRENLLKQKEMSREALIEKARTENPTWPEEELGPWAESKRQVSPKIVEVMTRVGHSWTDYVQRAQCPILLITADPERGAIVTPETSEKAAALWKDGQVVRIPNAGHCIHREQFDLVMDAAQQFLKRVF